MEKLGNGYDISPILYGRENIIINISTFSSFINFFPFWRQYQRRIWEEKKSSSRLTSIFRVENFSASKRHQNIFEISPYPFIPNFWRQFSLFRLSYLVNILRHIFVHDHNVDTTARMLCISKSMKYLPFQQRYRCRVYEYFQEIKCENISRKAYSHFIRNITECRASIPTEKENFTRNSIFFIFDTELDTG